jgi:ketosteroid isomerase-like protein
MTNEEKKNLVENYVRAYNAFNVEEMLSGLHRDVIFKNISGGETTLDLKGIEAFRKQAETAVDFFSEREQKIKNFDFSEDDCQIEIDYRATLAIDLPNGLKTGEKIELKGKSVFRFADGKIVEIQDIS